MNNNRPIARIDYLHTDGSIGESCYFYTESEFIVRVMEDNYYGTPMVVNVFRDENGETIPLDFKVHLFHDDRRISIRSKKPGDLLIFGLKTSRGSSLRHENGHWRRLLFSVDKKTQM